jgi:hypothetical protein
MDSPLGLQDLQLASHLWEAVHQWARTTDLPVELEQLAATQTAAKEQLTAAASYSQAA